MKKDLSLQLHLRPLARSNVQGLRVAIVGGTGGIGRALAHELAAHGAQVVVVGQTYRDADQPNIAFIRADLSLVREARRVASLLSAQSLNLLVFTTGIFAAKQRQQTAEGIERDMAVSFLSRKVILDEIASQLGTQLDASQPKARVFVMGYPGTGQVGTLGDLNAEKTYTAMGAHMNTVAGNEMLVLDHAQRHSHFNIYGLNPGLIKTDIRSNLLGGNKFLFSMVEGLIGLLTPTPAQYAHRMAPLLLAPELEAVSGKLFNNKAQSILPSPGLAPSHIAAFLAESQALVERAAGVPTV